MSWPIAIVVSVALIVIGVLSVVGADTSDLMLIVISVLGGMSVSELRSVKENTNGTNNALLRELTETRKALAQSIPPSTDDEVVTSSKRTR